jgi:hypothetical protein
MIITQDQAAQRNITAQVKDHQFAEKLVLLNGGIATLTISVIHLLGKHVSFGQLKNPLYLGFTLLLLGLSTICAMFAIGFVPTPSQVIVTGKTEEDYKKRKDPSKDPVLLCIFAFVFSTIACLFLMYFAISNPRGLFLQQPLSSASPPLARPFRPLHHRRMVAGELVL